jgi:hypothetical protein
MESREEQLFIAANKHLQEQEFSKALNKLNLLLETNQKHHRALALKTHITQILKFENTNIYGNTNLFMDPWEE